MDLHMRFRSAAIEEGIPQEEVDRFAEFLRFAIWTSRDFHGAPVGRRGGLPRLPVGMPWPVSRRGEPLPFIASFDCAALPRVDDLPLPADGSLLFFLSPMSAFNDRLGGGGGGAVAAERDHARVVYVPAGTDVAPAEPPAELGPAGPEYDLFAAVAAEVAGWLDDFDDFDIDQSRSADHLARGLPHLEQLCALVRRLWPIGGPVDVYLGGYTSGLGEFVTDYLENTPETQMADDILEARQKAGDIEIPPDDWERHLEEETLRVMREWVPLAQFTPHDSQVHQGRFLIRRDDLAAGRFDNALSYTAFTE